MPLAAHFQRAGATAATDGRTDGRTQRVAGDATANSKSSQIGGRDGTERNGGDPKFVEFPAAVYHVDIDTGSAIIEIQRPSNGGRGVNTSPPHSVSDCMCTRASERATRRTRAAANTNIFIDMFFPQTLRLHREGVKGAGLSLSPPSTTSPIH